MSESFEDIDREDKEKIGEQTDGACVVLPSSSLNLESCSCHIPDNHKHKWDRSAKKRRKESKEMRKKRRTGEK